MIRNYVCALMLCAPSIIDANVPNQKLEASICLSYNGIPNKSHLIFAYGSKGYQTTENRTYRIRPVEGDLCQMVDNPTLTIDATAQTATLRYKFNLRFDLLRRANASRSLEINHLPTENPVIEKEHTIALNQGIDDLEIYDNCLLSFSLHDDEVGSDEE